MIHPITPDLLLGSTFTLAGAGAIGHAMWNLNRALRSATWPVTTGEVTRSEVASEYSSGRFYYGAVEYRYEVSGRSFRGDRVTFGGPLKASWRSPAEATVRRYPKGKQVQVRYCPDEPGLAVLEPGASWYIWFVVAVGIVFLAYGLRRLLTAL